MLGHVGPNELSVRPVARFPNGPVQLDDGLHWNIDGLYGHVLDGLAAAAYEDPEICSIGVDSWAVDYGLLDGDGQLLADPVHYREARTGSAMRRADSLVPADELYRMTGVQQLPFNTAYQLMTDSDRGALASATAMLMIPDLLTYWLTGEIGAEVTNASTTQLYDVRSGAWAFGLISRLGLPSGLFPSLRQAGADIGALLPAVQEHTGLYGGVRVTAVGSHDTASAVVGVPATGASFAYISCGTWSLVGVELDQPVLSEASRKANFTNESGIDGTIRYLRNVMGLWLLQQCLQTWQSRGQQVGLPALLKRAAELPLASVVDADDELFLPFGDMPARIAKACAASGQPAPQTPSATVRCIVDSLALAYRKAVRTAANLSGHQVDVVHIVGGGVRNELLCQLTADACGVPVLAGPVEAAAIGNLLVQARAIGAVSGGLPLLRALIRETQPVRRYEPRGDQAIWNDAAARLSC